MLRRVVALEVATCSVADLHEDARRTYLAAGSRLPTSPAPFIWTAVPVASDPDEQNRQLAQREAEAPPPHRHWVHTRYVLCAEIDRWRSAMDAVMAYLPVIAAGPWVNSPDSVALDSWTARLSRHVASLGGVFNRIGQGRLPSLEEELAPALRELLPHLEQCREDLKSIPNTPLDTTAAIRVAYTAAQQCVRSGRALVIICTRVAAIDDTADSHLDRVAGAYADVLIWLNELQLDNEGVSELASELYRSTDEPVTVGPVTARSALHAAEQLVLELFRMDGSSPLLGRFVSTGSPLHWGWNQEVARIVRGEWRAGLRDRWRQIDLRELDWERVSILVERERRDLDRTYRHGRGANGAHAPAAPVANSTIGQPRNEPDGSPGTGPASRAALPDGRYPARWYEERTQGALYPDLLRIARRRRLIEGRKVCGRWYYNLASVCERYSEYTSALQAAASPEPKRTGTNQGEHPKH